MANLLINGQTYNGVTKVKIPNTNNGQEEFIQPTGTKQISTNGTHNVSDYANAEVNVQGGGGAPSIDDFSGGNILAIIGTGTQYIDTGYLPDFSGVFCIKLADSIRKTYAHYWGASNNSGISNRIGMQVNSGINFLFPGVSTATFVSVYPGWSDGDIITPVYGLSTSLTATSNLCFFRGYYNNALESSVAQYAFYGFNIMDTDFAWVKKYRPWLENGTPCVKELMSGDILYNSGTGTFSYIDLEGVTHNA